MVRVAWQGRIGLPHAADFCRNQDVPAAPLTISNLEDLNAADVQLRGSAPAKSGPDPWRARRLRPEAADDTVINEK